MAMVSNKFLAALAVKLGFHKHLRSGSAVIEASNRKFVEDIHQAMEKANGSPDYWTTVENPPKVQQGTTFFTYDALANQDVVSL